MAGTPKKRHKREHAQLSGELTTPEPSKITEEDVAAAMTAVPKKRGASPEFMREMTRRRMEKIASGDLSAKGGRPRTKRTRTEAEEDALQRLVPRALKVLEEQLEDPDERVRQSAAVKVLEYGKGKPAQAVKIDGDQTHTIRYETVVMLPGVVTSLPDAEEVAEDIIDVDPYPELPPAA